MVCIASQACAMSYIFRVQLWFCSCVLVGQQPRSGHCHSLVLYLKCKLEWGVGVAIKFYPTKLIVTSFHLTRPLKRPRFPAFTWDRPCHYLIKQAAWSPGNWPWCTELTFDRSGVTIFQTFKPQSWPRHRGGLRWPSNMLKLGNVES